MSRFAFTQVDVFTATALRGNPLAVVHGADALDDERMQAFARWTNLSETTFLLAPTDPRADYRVRIFTPGGELPFAGHPTLGSCHAWLERGGRPRGAGEVVQQCGVGLVRIRRDGAGAGVRRAAAARAEVGADDLDAVLAALGIGRERARRRAVAEQRPELAQPRCSTRRRPCSRSSPTRRAMKRFAAVGVVGAHPPGGECAFEVRGFVGRPTLYEDPVTGSLNAGLAEWLIGAGPRARALRRRAGHAPRPRRPRPHRARRHDVWVGGDTVTCIRGDVEL